MLLPRMHGWCAPTPTQKLPPRPTAKVPSSGLGYQYTFPAGGVNRECGVYKQADPDPAQSDITNASQVSMRQS